ncbi:unnamed protein product [Mesocestoides corti]|uniref:Uncharacterized protein n=1 Tax=Mesocestoides corti TaxID=53468 RepID=A0A0R3UAQ0_MESCO|nr:unnamed protein product [Mesocestoides corti]
MESSCPGIGYAIVWCLLSFIIGWPVAAFFACIYIILAPFAGCIPPLEQGLDLLLKLVKLPLTWSKKCVAMAPLSDSFFIGWPVAGFIAGIYIFLMPFAACIPPIEKFLDLLLKLVKLPLTWSKKGVAMAPLSDCSLE